MNYSGLYDGVFGEPHSLTSQNVPGGNAGNGLSRLFARRLYARADIREVLLALLGATPGQTATATHMRREAIADREGNAQGGLVPIEEYVGINRATTSADLVAIEAALTQQSQPTYPVDRSGNGGGGKLGY